MIKKLEKILDYGGTKKDITFLMISGIALVFSIFKISIAGIDLAWVAIILCGIPIILEAIIGLVTKFDIKADVLVSLALIASVCIHEDFAAGEVAFIMQVGGLLEELTVAKARAGIEKLVKLTPTTARVIQENNEMIIPCEKVQLNDVVRVLPGETIPVDGEILSGETSINEAILTGESLPVDKTIGDEVKSGTTNQFGSFDMKALKVGEDSSIQRMIRLVESADASNAKIVGLADRWVTWIVIIALSAAALTWIISGQIIRAVTILVVFCPCSLVLATPTAIMAAIGNATKYGFLVRMGDALEKLSTIKICTFDKTGTLTYGTPEVIHVKSYNLNENEFVQLVARAEKRIEHPLAKAIVRYYKEKIEDVDSFEMLPGFGVHCFIDGLDVIVGNVRLLSQHGIEVDDTSIGEYLNRGCTVIYCAINQKYAGYIVLSDVLREQSKDLIEKLKTMSIQPVLLTGDNERVAHYIASKVGIKEVKYQCLPEDKLNYISSKQTNQENVCMIGDGINDAPALKKAMVGIAMGQIGSDIAVDAADIVLVKDEINQLPHLLYLSKRMMKTIKLNLTFSMTLNFAAIILAITGILNPVVGALVHNAGSVLVITNSALLLNWRNLLSGNK